MCDHQHGFALGKPGKGCLHLSFIVRVGKGGGLVQNQDGRIFQHGACNGNALLLAAGQIHALGADNGMDTKILMIIFSFSLTVSAVSRLIPVFGMVAQIWVFIATDGIVTLAAVHAGALPHQAGVKQFRGGKVHIAQGRHNVRQTVLYGKLRRRAGGKFVIDDLSNVA